MIRGLIGLNWYWVSDAAWVYYKNHWSTTNYNARVNNIYRYIVQFFPTWISFLEKFSRNYLVYNYEYKCIEKKFELSFIYKYIIYIYI